MKRRLLLAAPLVILVTLFVVTGFRGVDLGVHWDEVEWHIEPVRTMARTGLFLPRSYVYPSLSKWLVLLPTLPKTIWTALQEGGDPVPAQAAMVAMVEARDYLLTARKVFIVVSSLSLVWLYCAVLTLRRSIWEATLAAACLGLSWEYAYHSRWVANDCVLTQFVALTLFLLTLFQRTGKDQWLYLAAGAVGLGTGAKQPGVFVLMLVIVASVLSLPVNAFWRQFKRLALIGAIAFACFVATTPGFLLEPFVFVTNYRSLSSIYGRGHAHYAATGPVQHIGWVITYLGLEFLSPFRLVSISLSACALLGGYAWWRRDRRFIIVMLSFPIVFLSLFCVKYVTMVARNYLQITPIFALLVARGIVAIFESLKRTWMRRSLAAALASVAVLQAAFLVRAGESIRHYDPKLYARQALAYVADHPHERFRISPQVRALLEAQHLASPANVIEVPGADAVVFLGRAEAGNPYDLETNNPWLTRAVFGPQEVNYNWYSTWAGNDRVVVMSVHQARRSRVPLKM
jgi:hypothetical protein